MQVLERQEVRYQWNTLTRYILPVSSYFCKFPLSEKNEHETWRSPQSKKQTREKGKRRDKNNKVKSSRCPTLMTDCLIHSHFPECRQYTLPPFQPCSVCWCFNGDDNQKKICVTNWLHACARRRRSWDGTFQRKFMTVETVHVFQSPNSRFHSPTGSLLAITLLVFWAVLTMLTI